MRKYISYIMVSITLILTGLFTCTLNAEDVDFNFVRVLKPAPYLPPDWEQERVSVVGQKITDTETANRLDFFHWQKNQDDISVVQFYYSMNFPSYITNRSGLIQCIENSAAAWGNIPTANLDMQVVSGIDFSDYYNHPTLYDPPWIVDNKNVISFSYGGEIIGFNNDVAIGKTFITWDSGDIDGDGDTNELIDCDIILNASEFDCGGHFIWTIGQMDYANNEIDVQSVVTHEMGHVLGIAHPYTSKPEGELDCESCPTMYAAIQPAFVDTLRMRSLEDYDKNCATFLYPILDDGNGTWETATPITGSEAGTVYTNLSITEGDYDWYKIWLDQYDTVKIVIQEPSATEDVKLYITLTPSIFNPSTSSTTNNVEVYQGSMLRYKSKSYLKSYQTVYAHTVTIPGEYYILAMGYYSSSESDYTLTAYTCIDGDFDYGEENPSKADYNTDPIPAGDGIDDALEIANGLDPSNIYDAASDLDNDDLISSEEINIHTNPLNEDTDSDGMQDGWEYYNNLNPLVDDAALDSDNDGMTNLEEFIADTDPQDSNSVIAVRTLTIYSVETGFGDPIPGIMIHWANIMAFNFEILYSTNPKEQFQLMEEFQPGNEFEAGTSSDNFIDIGYPEPPATDAGTIRPAPLSDGINSRYYIIRKKIQ
ncbi:hypothetical protein J7L67_09725 [bacterium]|nr:hypothetical protein [bacterium]